MKLPWHIFLYQFLIGLILVCILKLYEMSIWYSQTDTQWTTSFLKKWENEVFFLNLRKWLTASKRVKANMAPIKIAPDYTKMSGLEKYQFLLSQKYAQIERNYYPIVDDLVQKLNDMDGIDKTKIPDFDLEQFQFIKEWQSGKVDSQYVCTILKSWDFNTVSKSRITRRLTNFIMHRTNQSAVDCVKAVHDQLIKDVVPLYETYLIMLLSYFERTVTIDDMQPKVSWIQETFTPSGTVSRRLAEYTLNQTLRLLDHNVIGYNENKYFVGDNLVALDEDLDTDDWAIHWIFAPKVYIDVLKEQFNIVKSMDLQAEKTHIQKVVGAYVNDKA